MNINEVIKYPILSEKSYQQMATGVYTFAVDFRTNKAEVKKVVEHIFDVKVGRVNIMTVQKKAKKVGRFEGMTNRYKKAIVTVTEGTINIFPEEVEEVKETKEVKDKAVKTEMSDAEKKAAAKIAAMAEAKTESKEKVKAPVKEETKVEAPVVEEVKTQAPAKEETKVEEVKEESKTEDSK